MHATSATFTYLDELLKVDDLVAVLVCPREDLINLFVFDELES